MAATRTRRRAPASAAGAIAPPAESRSPRIDSDRPRSRTVTNEGLVPLSTRVPPDVLRDAKITAIEVEVSLQEAVAEAMREWVARRKRV